MATTTQYTAIQPFHYPDGAVSPGEVIALAPDVAQRGIETGALVVTPAAPAPAKPVAPEAPSDPPAVVPDPSEPKE